MEQVSQVGKVKPGLIELCSQIKHYRSSRHLRGLPALGPDAQRNVEKGTAWTVAAIELMWAALEVGTHVLCLFPMGTLVEEFGPMQELRADPRMLGFRTDYCRWGAGIKRSTWVLTTYPGFQELGKRCTCREGHAGQVFSSPPGGPMVPFPSPLASAVAMAARRGSFG